MKTAIIRQGASIAQGGVSIDAAIADYDTYLKEMVVCRDCGNPVFLKAKNSQYKKPHWAHFPGTGINCPAKSNSIKAIATNAYTKQDSAWKQQSLSAVKQHLLKMLLHTYKIKNDPYCNPKKALEISRLVHELVIPGLHPKKHYSRWIKNIFPLAKNLTALIECAEIMWEDFITAPFDNSRLVGWGKSQCINRKSTEVSPYLQAVISDKAKMSELLLNRSIFLEVVKFMSLIESTQVLEWWIAMHWLEVHCRLEAFNFSIWVDRLNQIDMPKYFLLASIGDMIHLPWRSLVEDARSGNFQERPIERIIYNPFHPIFNHLFPILTPLNRSSIKGFGR